MGVTKAREILETVEKDLERLANELRELQKEANNDFEQLDTDLFLTEVYN